MHIGHLVSVVRVVVICSLLNISTAVAGPLEDGYAAVLAGDYKSAFSLLRPLADQGVPAAEYAIGSMYLSGKGTAVDEAQGVRWTALAANQGYPYAQIDFGLMLENGIGVPLNRVQALKWYYLASDSARNTDPETREEAAMWRDALAREMSPAELTEAKRLAAQWTPVMQ